MHFVFELVKIGKGCSADETSEGMADERDPGKLAAWTGFSYILMNFLSKSVPHIEDVSLGIIFICLRTEELSLREGNRNRVFEHPDIERAALEAMH